jgi:hypothetical protein
MRSSRPKRRGCLQLGAKRAALLAKRWPADPGDRHTLIRCQPVKVADEARTRPPVGEAELEERLGARRDREPVGRADQVAAPLVAAGAERGAHLGLVAVGLEDEREADVLAQAGSSNPESNCSTVPLAIAAPSSR